jgi:hypothetical protein
MTTTEQASCKERFELLHSTLSSYNERYVKAVLTVTGALLVIIGWLTTSQRVFELFRSSAILSSACVAVIAFLIYVYCSTLSRVYRINHVVYEKLRSLAYVDQDYYRHDLLPRRYHLFGLAINIWNYALIAALIANARWPFMN